ncbi:MAG: 2 3-bisphosphoglycerate-independent phosphoglycerate mutase [Rhodobacteraceae bacterium]|uniref:2,3-bisphosphoglycerate-independent phosphoglycerate mutase n=1 Tax=Cypionkella sp. TaxID=2811411 RepID=UPI001327AE83|nr:2,3-bisphosphoglycerate-independent phosphoglycerate mutase [Cypionkella sp.]KAF0176044.1 MAG: 2 3-bisphosphoglycerate-independent phosphoglycerate mutase [Paracoccaceae bacterium]MDO8328786.1 2,3-bisphosphoglycerate-independent phosphoglycerate mutase [Cypionkella sp.]
MSRKPVVLCILDGWGINADPTASAPAQADVLHFNRIWAECPHSTLTTFGPDVGLPTGQMGNSEVGHTNIGAGRVVAMDLGAIDLAIEDGSFAQNAEVLAFATQLKASGGVAHLMGVVSDGGVHGHLNHVLAACRAITALGVPVVLHAITDGRDVAPSSAGEFVEQLMLSLPAGAKVATVIGRYWAMDRDNRWERVRRAYDAMVNAKGEAAATPQAAVAASYAKGETDEFLAPSVIGDYAGARDGDGFFCLNFRSDRAREILAALAAPGFDGFATGKRPVWAALLGMVEYSAGHNEYMTTAYPKRSISNTLGEWVAKQGRTQFRLAETEKYPHVTFFLNGGREVPFEGEDRAMPKSPKVATYDLQPEMSAGEVSDHLVAAIETGYDLIVVNFANPDMVGHTGSLPAAIKACEAVDQGLGRALAALQAKGGAMIVTADHGNCEMMIDPVTGGPHTSHTTNPVPVVLVGGPASATLREGGRLADLAPTILALMGLPQPPEMTGRNLMLA